MRSIEGETEMGEKERKGEGRVEQRGMTRRW